jgi:AcrR family transcriptional regulator
LKGEQTRRRILLAAEHVFGDKGYHATSISDIAARAKVAQGTLYLYFSGKLGLFVELFEELGHDMRERLHHAATDADGRIDKERAGLRAFLEYIARHPRIYRIAREAEFVVPERFYEWYDHLIDPYERGLKEAVINGEIRPINATVVAYALVGMAHFVGLQLVVRKGLKRVPDTSVEELVDFIANGLRPTTTLP